ncbi:pectin lyase fold/virulence factor, partial [Bisporella sp. PMI_857]
GLPASSGSSILSAVQTIEAGEPFDGGKAMYGRGVSCAGQTEGGGSDAVFRIEEGSSPNSVIIGPRRTLTNVWWSTVCDDAFMIKDLGAGDTTFINRGGVMSISGFTISDFGRVCQSSGNCRCMLQRHVIISGVTAIDGDSLAGDNSSGITLERSIYGEAKEVGSVL